MWLRGAATRYAGLALLSLLGIAFAGCAAHKRAASTSSASVPAATSSGGDHDDANATNGPQASIHVSYAHPNDYLSALIVTKYSGAQIIQTSAAGKEGTPSIIRFEGGITVWQINVDKSVLASLPVLDFKNEYQLKQITYATMPRHFLQTLPDSGPPEPLEPD
ncbi:MAG: hypothetical protein ACREQN_18220, partial [Candidatus Binataceae bacterium]